MAEELIWERLGTIHHTFDDVDEDHPDLVIHSSIDLDPDDEENDPINYRLLGYSDGQRVRLSVRLLEGGGGHE